LIVCRPREQRAEEEALSSKNAKTHLKDVKERKRDDRGRQAGRTYLHSNLFTLISVTGFYYVSYYDI